ncbi:MAG: hypothetical protein DME71_11580 [Verrucomicrobia bacterium]|nr:MAG: hypothetical protein DME71_11580 [Verrucomicrobiota bacterium]
MNQTALLRIVERLERLLAKLPEKIRRPVLRELTPLKELFLQQRPPRFLFIGSSKIPTHRIIDTLFTAGVPEQMNVALMPVHRWIDWDISGHGTFSVLDARDAGDSAAAQVKEDLKRQPADIIFLFDDAESNLEKSSAANFLLHMQHNFGGALGDAKVIGVAFGLENRARQLEEGLKTQPAIRDRLLKVIQFADTNAHKIDDRDLHCNRSATDPAGRHADSHLASGGDGLGHHVHRRSRTKLARCDGIYHRARRKRRRRNGSPRRCPSGPEVFSRLGQCGLRHDRRRRHVCDRPRGQRVFHRWRLIERCTTKISGRPEEGLAQAALVGRLDESLKVH